MFKKIYAKIKAYDIIIIHRHIRPDGDALGSQIGLREALRISFPKKQIYAVGEENSRFAFIGDMDIVDDSLYKNALVIVLDSSTTDMISDDRYKLADYIIKIDHHKAGKDYGDLIYVDIEEISSASIVTDFINKENLQLNDFGARALFTGIVTDSGRFRYEGVSSKTFNLVAKLLEYSFSITEIYNHLYIDDLDYVRLKAEMTLKFKIKNNVAFLKTTKEEVQSYGVDVFTISRGMVGVMGGIKGIDIWVNFTEKEDTNVFAEIRSNKLDVSNIAQKYGGGGHKLASGATLENFEVAKAMLDDLVELAEDVNE